MTASANYKLSTSSDIVIRAENLSKRYLLSHRKREGYTALRDVIAMQCKNIGNKLIHPFRSTLNAQPSTKEEFWALKDVSFEIKQGDRVGIIGRNGAGKTTLLKILSRITEPTTGRVTIKGRVASLLEVGTGFHPELTGRENIYLNGAILGMTKAEIKQKFDEIVDFAEIEKFLDTPVKRYSSGMYVRLAFAVAAHLEPEILIVDEVLAVGDAQFQKKCLGKMEDVSAKEGRTVLFVSHNMAAMKNLCKKAILLKSGTLVDDGLVSEVTEKFIQDSTTTTGLEDLDRLIKNLPPDPAFRLESIRLKQNSMVVERVLNGRPLEIEIRYRLLKKVAGFRVFFDLCDTEETLLFRSFHDEDTDSMPVMLPGSYVSMATIPAHVLGPIGYELRICAGIYNVRYCMPLSGIKIRLMVESTGNYNRAYLADKFCGKLAMVIPWTIEREEV